MAKPRWNFQAAKICQPGKMADGLDMVESAPEIIHAYRALIRKYGSQSPQADEAAEILGNRKNLLSDGETLALLRAVNRDGTMWREIYWDGIRREPRQRPPSNSSSPYSPAKRKPARRIPVEPTSPRAANSGTGPRRQASPPVA
jgi:hypothetical protein